MKEVVECTECAYAHLTEGGVCEYCDALSSKCYFEKGFYCAYGRKKTEADIPVKTEYKVTFWKHGEVNERPQSIVLHNKDSAKRLYQVMQEVAACKENGISKLVLEENNIIKEKTT